LEVGANYVKTKRGIVTKSVLIKRSSAFNIIELIDFMRSTDLKNYNELMTPTKQSGGQT